MKKSLATKAYIVVICLRVDPLLWGYTVCHEFNLLGNAFLLNTILEPTFVEILVALFSGESWIAFALVAADRVPACGVLGIARVRQALVHVLFAPHALEARLEMMGE